MSYQPHHTDPHTAHMQGSHDDYQQLADLPFDPFEVLVLEITRHFIVGIHHPASHAWMDAFFIAEDRMGQPYGALVASHVLKVVNAVRKTRSAGFNYCNPHCLECARFITQEERYLITALYSLRRDNRSHAQTQAMLLCQGEDDTNVIMTLKHLALSINDPMNEKTGAMS